MPESAARLQRNIAAAMKRLRRLNGLSQGQIARRVGVSVAFISMIEQKRRIPSLDTLALIAAALDVRAIDLLGDAGNARIDQNEVDVVRMIRDVRPGMRQVALDVLAVMTRGRIRKRRQYLPDR